MPQAKNIGKGFAFAGASLLILNLLFFLFYPTYFLSFTTHVLDAPGVDYLLLKMTEFNLLVSTDLRIDSNMLQLVGLEVNPWMQNQNWLANLFSLVFKSLPAALNFTIILHVSLAAIGAYLWAYQFLKDHWYSLFLALIFSLLPARLGNLEQEWSLLFMGFVPWYFYTWEKALQANKTSFFPYVKSWGFLLLNLLFLVLNLLSSYSVLLIALSYPMVRMLSYWFNNLWNQTNKIRLLIYSGLVLIGLGGLVYLILSSVGLDVSRPYSIALSQLWIPFESLIYSGPWSLGLDGYFPLLFKEAKSILFVSYALILLYFLAFYKRKHFQTNFFQFKAAGVLMGFLLVFPALAITKNFLIYMPGSVLLHLPFIPDYYHPVGFLCFAMSLLMLWTFSVFLQQKRNLWLQRYPFVLLVMSLFVLEAWPKPAKFLAFADVPQVYHELQKYPSGSLLSLPFFVENSEETLGNVDSRYLRFAAIHQKPILGGMFEYKANLDQVENDAFLIALLNAQATEQVSGIDFQAVQQAFDALEIKFINVPLRYQESAAHNLLRYCMGSKYQLQSIAVDQLYLKEE